MLMKMENLVASACVSGKSSQSWQKGVVMGIKSVSKLHQDLKDCCSLKVRIHYYTASSLTTFLRVCRTTWKISPPNFKE